MQQNWEVGGHTARDWQQGVSGARRKHKLHINVLEMKAAKLSIESFCRVKKKQNQFTYKSATSLGENGRNKEHRTQQNFEGKSGVLNWEQDQTYCRIPPKLSKQSGRLGIMPYQVLEWVEIVSPDIFCITPVTSTPSVHVMETGPLL